MENIQDKALKFLYESAAGNLCVNVLTKKWFSEITGKFMNTSLSTAFIPRFIANNGIDMSKYEKKEYKSFNEFFARKLAVYNINFDINNLSSPCDSRLSVYKIDENSIFSIKNKDYNISDMIKSSEAAKRFVGGYCLIFRLCVDDYHRYHFFDDGEILKTFKINGEYHTVNPIALNYKNFYKLNCREITVMRTSRFGIAVQIEVGAMLVGRICNIKKSGNFKKGEEKGYFEFGGSTIVLLLQPNNAEIDEKILKNTKIGIETQVKYGEIIGKSIK